MEEIYTRRRSYIAEWIQKEKSAEVGYDIYTKIYYGDLPSRVNTLDCICLLYYFLSLESMVGRDYYDSLRSCCEYTMRYYAAIQQDQIEKSN